MISFLTVHAKLVSSLHVSLYVRQGFCEECVRILQVFDCSAGVDSSSFNYTAPSSSSSSVSSSSSANNNYQASHIIAAAAAGVAM